MGDATRRNVGDAVVVTTLRNKRGTILEAGARGRYRVLVEGVTTWCRDQDLAAPPEPSRREKKKAPADEGGRTTTRSTGSARPAGARARIDLHGLTVEEALARTTDAIDRALQQGADRLEIVHGKGSGRIRAALHRHLQVFEVVKAFHLDARNPGVTWVFFGRDDGTA